VVPKSTSFRPGGSAGGRKLNKGVLKAQIDPGRLETDLVDRKMGGGKIERKKSSHPAGPFSAEWKRRKKTQAGEIRETIKKQERLQPEIEERW